VIGAIAGGILGNIIAGDGNRTTGTLVGAGVGGIAGNQIGKSGQRRCEERQWQEQQQQQQAAPGN
jgi:uncharacterized protein YcfJ